MMFAFHCFVSIDISTKVLNCKSFAHTSDQSSASLFRCLGTNTNRLLLIPLLSFWTKLAVLKSAVLVRYQHS